MSADTDRGLTLADVNARKEVHELATLRKDTKMKYTVNALLYK
jgi:hypothetical protein